jgi:hypothetical protein
VHKDTKRQTDSVTVTELSLQALCLALLGVVPGLYGALYWMKNR